MDSDPRYVQTATAGPAIVLGIYLVYLLLAPKAGFWAQVPWSGRRREWFASVRTSLRAIKGLGAMAEDGYRQYSKLNRLFVLPNPARGPIVILPPSQIRNVLNKPDGVLDPAGPQHESVQSKYTVRDRRVTAKDFHFAIIRRQLTRALAGVTADINEELGLAFDQLWGTDAENWREVNVYESCMKAVARTSNRVFVGPPLCRNEDFLEHCRLYAQGFFTAAAIINRFPNWSHPFLGRLIAMPNDRNERICLKHSRPVIEERLKNSARKRVDPDFDWEAPNDYLQWHIDESYKRDDPEEREPELINSRALVVNTVTIHTSTMSITNTLLDLYSTSPSDGYVEGLREECSRILSEDDGVWTKAGVSRMLRTDSTIRETMRHSTTGLVSLTREVAAPGGVDFGYGMHVPKGARVGFVMHPIHHDEDFYPDPNRYDPFRFSRPHEAYDAELLAKKPPGGIDEPGDEAKVGKDLKRVLAFKNQSLVTVGDTFLPFGHGKHACPGRFFASHEIKLMLAYIVQNYDIKPMAERIPSYRFLEVAIPPPWATIQIRRRKASV